jgi:prolyl-tRNA synthetase
MIVAVRRNSRAKCELSLASLDTTIPQMLERIHLDMYDRADEKYRTCRKLIADWNVSTLHLDNKNPCIVFHCTQERCESVIKDRSKGNNADEEATARSLGAKSVCMPFEQPNGVEFGDTNILNRATTTI